MRYDLADIIKREREGDAGFELDLGGTVITVPPSILWPDEALPAALKGDGVTAAKLILGDDYAAFTAAGGTSRLLERIITDHNGATSPESTASTDS